MYALLCIALHCIKLHCNVYKYIARDRGAVFLALTILVAHSLCVIAGLLTNMSVRVRARAFEMLNDLNPLSL